MKSLKLGISVLALAFAATSVSAQNTSHPWLIGVGAHGENYVATRPSNSSFKAKQLFSIGNYSITPPLSKLTVARSINKWLAADLQASVGNVKNKRFAMMDKEFFLQAGLGLQFKPMGFINEDSWFDPYVRVGANYLRNDLSSYSFAGVTDVNGKTYSAYDGKGNINGKSNHFTVATGLGVNFWLAENFGLGIQGDYVGTPGNKSDVANFWQAGASLLFRFGGKAKVSDRDGDGIPDDQDRCPDTPGLAEFQGCPDTDGDGIPDIDDRCPDTPGLAEFQGCPDTDGDGVADIDDNCPNVPGPVENKGCPWPDRDGDGIPDKDDACPDEPGLREYNGCPAPAESASKQLQDILFDFDKATITASSASKLDAAADIIKKVAKEGDRFLVVGMTDAKGNANYNLGLSKRRAAAVVTALESRGVNPDQLKSMGIGAKEATVPATASDAARQVDRKVVVKAITDAAEWSGYKKNN